MGKGGASPKHIKTGSSRSQAETRKTKEKRGILRKVDTWMGGQSCLCEATNKTGGGRRRKKALTKKKGRGSKSGNSRCGDKRGVPRKRGGFQGAPGEGRRQ